MNVFLAVVTMFGFLFLFCLGAAGVLLAALYLSNWRQRRAERDRYCSPQCRKGCPPRVMCQASKPQWPL